MSNEQLSNVERRFCELRAEDDGRTLTGVAVRYGSEARLPWGRERIRSGAFGDVRGADVILNFQHNPDRPLARTGGGGLALEDDADALRVRAVLPQTRDADDALALVRGKVLRGLSLEFVVRTERIDADVRVIESASLRGIGLVDKPAYRDSAVAARAKRPFAWWF